MSLPPDLALFVADLKRNKLQLVGRGYRTLDAAEFAFEAYDLRQIGVDQMLVLHDMRRNAVIGRRFHGA